MGLMSGKYISLLAFLC